MIDIVICTFKRLDKQITLNEIPESYRDNVTLVVQPQEEKQAKKIHKNIFVLDSDNIGYAKTIKQTTYEWSINRNKHFFLFDDDLQFRYNEEIVYGKRGKKSKMTEKNFYDMFSDIQKELDKGLMHGGLGTTWVYPWGKIPYVENSRLITNKFYNKKLKEIWHKIDWDNCCGAEDYYVNLQLLTRGYNNKTWYKYVVFPAASYADGGCSDYRTLEYHNKSCFDLKSKFPDFVKLGEKIETKGKWKGMLKFDCYVQWKKAYQSSQVGKLDI